MASNVTEIVEQSDVQLEIIESKGGQIEVINPEQTSIEISFSGSSISSDLDITTETNTLVVESTQNNVNIDILTNDPTTIETTTTTNTVEIKEESGIILQTGSIYNITNTTVISGDNQSNILFQTQSDVSNALLSNLVVKDYSNDVVVNVSEGKLELIFGTPSQPFSEDIIISNFDTNRFNLVTDNYTITPSYDLNGATFFKGELSSSLGGITTFGDGETIIINEINHPSYTSGSHTFSYKIDTILTDNTLYSISTTKEVNLNKLKPTDPTLNITYNITPSNAYNNPQNEIEVGAQGDISWDIINGITEVTTNGIGWQSFPFKPFSVATTNPQTTPLQGTTGNITIDSLNPVRIAPIEQYWFSGIENNPRLTYTGSTKEQNWTRIRSLRYGTWVESALTEIDLSGLNGLNFWESQVGTIKYGFNTPSEIETQILDFSPNTTTGEFLYIVYSSSLNNIDTLINQTSNQNEITAFNPPYIEGEYKIYRSKTPKNGSNYQHKITFI
jgi:hypothetical protein